MSTDPDWLNSWSQLANFYQTLPFPSKMCIQTAGFGSTCSRTHLWPHQKPPRQRSDRAGNFRLCLLFASIHLSPPHMFSLFSLLLILPCSSSSSSSSYSSLCAFFLPSLNYPLSLSSVWLHCVSLCSGLLLLSFLSAFSPSSLASITVCLMFVSP